MLATYGVAMSSARLPLELFMIIKQFIATSDLRTHVCFYNTCRTFASLYGDSAEQAAFWRRSCLLSGLTFIGQDSSYKDIAFECIVQDGFCPHPHCGGNLLEWNAKQVQFAINEYGWDPEEGPWLSELEDGTASTDSGAMNYPPLVTNKILAHVMFRERARAERFSKLDDVFLRFDDIPPHRQPLRHHPIAWRSSATFPSINFMTVDYVDSRMRHLVNMSRQTWIPEGVIAILGVLDLGTTLDDELSTSELRQLLEGSFSCLRPKHPVDFIEELKKYATLRGLWSASQWKGLVFEGTWSDEEGALFVHAFSALPNDVKHTRELLDEDIRDYTDETGLL